MRLNIEKLSFAYSQKLVLSNVSFNLASGDFLSILGKNGTGKSTLIKCILGLLSVPNNTIYIDDIDINQRKQIFNIGYVPQRLDFNFEYPITVKELLTAAYLKRRDNYYNSVINSLDLNKFYHQNINTLSGGQMQRVFIARALLNKPKLLIFDEPTVGVDTNNINVFKGILKDLKRQQITILLVTHDKEYIEDVTDYYLNLDEELNYSFYQAGDKI